MSTKDEINDITEILVKRKGKLFGDYLNALDKKRGLQPVPLKDVEAYEKNEVKVKTGTVVDEIIGGGIPEGKSVLFYGEFRSGKTQTCLTMAALCENKVVYIDTEASLRAERMEQICKTRGLDWAKIRDKIIYYQPKNWIEQMSVLWGFPAPADVEGKIDLVICDSISKHFRGVEFMGRQTLQVKNGLLREFILSIEQIAKQHKAAFVYTTQIYDTPSATPYSTKSDIQKPVGGRSAEHQPDFVLFFKKGTGNVRIVEMMDSSYTALAERAFLINEKGIDNIPEGSKVSKGLEERQQKFADKQKQENVLKGKTKESKEEETEESATEEEEIA
jgi:RecA/RadA recombinase